jgi:FkbM family methyltransferase
MRKIFIDLGSHNGQTLLLAMKKYPKMDLFIGVEPVTKLYKQSVDRIPQEFKAKTQIIQGVVDYQSEPEKTVTFYEDIGTGHKLGSSLMPDKNNKKTREIQVQSIDIRTFFKPFCDDEITLKIDVEGKEYDILNGMVKHGLLKNVKKLFVEWHWDKVKSLTEERHNKIVAQLNTMGYKLTGDRKIDEFYGGKA